MSNLIRAGVRVWHYKYKIGVVVKLVSQGLAEVRFGNTLQQVELKNLTPLDSIEQKKSRIRRQAPQEIRKKEDLKREQFQQDEPRNRVRQFVEEIVAHSIALDLETDGETIREIGVADSSGRRTLYDKNKKIFPLGDALKILSQRIEQKKFIVGHNAAQWDIPILQKLRPKSFTKNLVIWDTLLISCLMSPWERSHALGGIHRAEDDAQQERAGVAG